MAATTTVAHPRAAAEAAAWLAAHLGLLTALTAALGLRPFGWAVGIGCGATILVLLGRASGPTGGLGPADRVTLARALLVACAAALVCERTDAVAALSTIAALALALDFVDGQVARRTGTESAVGARFDMEVDAFLILVLSVHAALVVGPWVLLIGLMRYLFVAAAWGMPWLRGPLPPSRARKAVAAGQGVALVVAVAVPACWYLAVALAALAWSFGRDVRWLRAHRARGVRP